MANHFSQRPLIIRDENLDIHHKNSAFDGNIKSSKTVTKKGGVALRNRKALNDITNKASLHHVPSSHKNNLSKEEFNVADEMFLHDHKKCIKEQQIAMKTFSLDMVLPGYDHVSTTEDSEIKQSKTDPGSPCYYPEPAELPMSEFSDWLESSTQWHSPPCSPICWDTPPSSPFAWNFEVDYVLKAENDV